MGLVDRLIESSLRKRALVLVGVVILIGLGVWSVLRIPIDAFPDVTNIQVEVMSTSPGMSPPEVERGRPSAASIAITRSFFRWRLTSYGTTSTRAWSSSTSFRARSVCT